MPALGAVQGEVDGCGAQSVLVVEHARALVPKQHLGTQTQAAEVTQGESEPGLKNTHTGSGQSLGPRATHHAPVSRLDVLGDPVVVPEAVVQPRVVRVVEVGEATHSLPNLPRPAQSDIQRCS